MDVEAFRRSPLGTVIDVGDVTDGLGRFSFVLNADVPTPRLDEATWSAVVDASVELGRLEQAAVDLEADELASLRRAIRVREASAAAGLDLAGVFDHQLAQWDERPSPPSPRAVAADNHLRATEHADTIAQPTVDGVSQIQLILVQGTPDKLSDAGGLRDRRIGVGDAAYIPASPGRALSSGFDGWLAALRDDAPLLPPVARAALAFHRFLAVAPFSTANEAVGLITLVGHLRSAGALDSAPFLATPWFTPRWGGLWEEHIRATQSGNLNGWVRFVVAALDSQARTTRQCVSQLRAYSQTCRERRERLGLRGAANTIAGRLIVEPVVSVSRIARQHDISFQTANVAVAKLVGAGILSELTGKRHGRRFAAADVLAILEARPIASA